MPSEARNLLILAVGCGCIEGVLCAWPVEAGSARLPGSKVTFCVGPAVGIAVGFAVGIAGPGGIVVVGPGGVCVVMPDVAGS